MKPAQGSRVDSWKAIAEYLGRNVRTATRWADERGLPVHRVPGGKRGAVFAFTAEVDAWLLSQGSAERGAVAEGYKELGGLHPGNAREDSPKWALRLRQLSQWRFALPVLLLLLVIAGVAVALRPKISHASQLFLIRYGADTLE